MTKHRTILYSLIHIKVWIALILIGVNLHANPLQNKIDFLIQKGIDKNEEEEEDSSVYYLNEALLLVEEQDLLSSKAHIFNVKAELALKNGNFRDVIGNYMSALKIYKITQDIESQLFMLTKIGEIYHIFKDENKAILFLEEAMILAAKLKDSSRLYNIKESIGINLYEINEYDKAYVYFNQVYQYYKKKGHNTHLIRLLARRSVLLSELGQFDTSMADIDEAIVISNSESDTIQLTMLYLMKTELYLTFNKPEEAIKILQINQFKASVNKELKSRAQYYLLYSKAANQKGDISKSLQYAELALEDAVNAADTKQIVEIYDVLVQLYVASGDYKKAFEYMRNHADMKELLEESFGIVSQLETRVEIERSEKDLQLKEAELEKQKEREKLQNLVIIAVSLGLALMLIIAVLIFIQNKARKKANIMLESQKNEILEKNKELEIQQEEIIAQKEMIEDNNKILEHKNKEITDSINYAKRIQDSLLPKDDVIKNYLQNYFILFKPKDILSGDFYWFQEFPPQKEFTAKNADNILMAAVDCTGHGVSGAMMSVVGSNLLNQAVLEFEMSQPSDILNFLHAGVIDIWKKNQESSELTVQDGMDIALVNINLRTYQLNFSGAKRPLYIIRNNEIIELKPDKIMIGDFTFSDMRFTHHEFQLQKNDMVYMLSDGFGDQFGGPKNKKFKEGNLKKLFSEIAKDPVKKQFTTLNSHFEEWKSYFEQTDDVLIIGISIT